MRFLYEEKRKPKQYGKTRVALTEKEKHLYQLVKAGVQKRMNRVSKNLFSERK